MDVVQDHGGAYRRFGNMQVFTGANMECSVVRQGFRPKLSEAFLQCCPHVPVWITLHQSQWSFLLGQAPNETKLALLRLNRSLPSSVARPA